MAKVEFRPNTIYCGDCKDILHSFPENSVDLIYIDPPFFTSRNYEVVFGNGYELRGFQDVHWYDESGKRKEDIYVYLDWLRERVEECYRVLKKTGSFYLHCDWHANAYIRVYVLDRVFGRDNFRNEITWVYARPAAPKQRIFCRAHETIFFYTKSDNWCFYPDAVRLPYKESTIKRAGFMSSAHGRKFVREIRTGGKFPEDWWDIPYLRPNSKESKGYPTQKPKRLLERIIKASSKEGDLILDPMCGCGTTIEAAQILGRRWIGIDISPTACKLMRDQIARLIPESPYIWNLPMTVEELKKLSWMEFQNWVCEKLNARVSERYHRDMGIDGYTFFDNAPISVKQSEHVGRPDVDKFETAIRRYYAGSKREMRGLIVAFSFTSGKDGAYEEAARAKMDNGIDIKLITVTELLKQS